MATLAHDLMSWLQTSKWHYCLRLPSDVLLHGPRRYSTTVSGIYPKLGEAAFYRHVGLWSDGVHRCNLVVATPQGVKEPWAVITDELPVVLQTLWQYALRFRCRCSYSKGSKSGAFEERRFSSALGRCSGTLVSGCCGRPALWHHPGYGGTNRGFTSAG